MKTCHAQEAERIFFMKTHARSGTQGLEEEESTNCLSKMIKEGNSNS